MQATPATRRAASSAQTAQASSAELAREMYTLFAYLLDSSTPQFFRALSDADVTLTQVKLLHMLDQPDADHSLKDLAEELSFSLAGASRSIDALHQRGLVERREDERDRRMKRVQITGEGRNLLRHLNEMRVGWLQQFIETLSEAERRKLLAAVSPVVAREQIAAFRPEGPSA
jgi:DNA-binding MarR family transcriptional regulator